MSPKRYFSYCRQFELPISKLVALLVLFLIATGFETFAVVLLLPVLQFLESKGNIASLLETSDIWPLLDIAARQLGVPLGLEFLLAIAFGAILSRQVITFTRIFLNANIIEKLTRDIQDKVFRAFLQANTDYHDSISSGDITNVLAVESRHVSVGMLLVIELLAQCIQMLVYIGVLAGLSPLLTVTTLAVLIVTAILLRRYMRLVLRYGRLVANANKEMLAYLSERLRSPRLIRLSGTEPAEREYEYALTTRVAEIGISAARVQAGTEVVIEPIVVGVGFLLIYFGFTVLEMELGTIGLFLFILLRLMPVAKAIIVGHQGLLGSLGHFEMTESRLNAMAAASEDDGGELKLAALSNGIRFNDVFFQYQSANAPALQKISLDIPAHKLTALVGPSGSGKSTLIDLLPGLRIPSSGVVLFDGIPISEFTRRSLRSQIAYVPQTPQMFDISIEDHIRMGNPTASEAELISAAELAGAHEFITAMPTGYTTMLGEGGVRLSGGQKQRIDLARALLRKASILILDEPTSNLDSESEFAFRAALSRIRDQTDTTIILIAHNLLSVVGADQIVVLHGGQVQATGTHEKLLAISNWYRAAFTRQECDGTGPHRQHSQE